MELGLRNKDIAGFLGVSDAYVSFLCSGKRRPSWSMAKRLVDVFGKTPAWWMEAKKRDLVRALRSGGMDGKRS
jgi:plasmid maintenance system antidote protein VapI